MVKVRSNTSEIGVCIISVCGGGYYFDVFKERVPRMGDGPTGRYST